MLSDFCIFCSFSNSCFFKCSYYKFFPLSLSLSFSFPRELCLFDSFCLSHCYDFSSFFLPSCFIKRGD